MEKIRHVERSRRKKPIVEGRVRLYKRKLKIYFPILLQKQFIGIAIFSFLIFFSLFLFLNKLPDFKKLSFTKLIVSNSNILSSSKKDKNCLTCNKSEMYDPYILTQKIQVNNPLITIVDIRSKDEYLKGHIKNAINIPVYTSLNNIEKSEISDSEIVSKFSGIKTSQIIIYGNAASSIIPTSVKNLLATNNISSQVLSIGWNEWHDFRNVWVPQAVWNTFDPDKYSVLSK